MSALTLTLRTPPARSIDLPALTPERLAGLNAAQPPQSANIDGERALHIPDMF